MLCGQCVCFIWVDYSGVPLQYISEKKQTEENSQVSAYKLALWVGHKRLAVDVCKFSKITFFFANRQQEQLFNTIDKKGTGAVIDDQKKHCYFFVPGLKGAKKNLLLVAPDLGQN